MRTLALTLLVLSSVACIGDGDLEGDSDSTPIAAIAPQGQGNISLEWSIFVGDTQASCVDAGADSVVLVLSDGSGQADQVMACLGGLADSGAVDAGDYDVAARLVDYEGTVLDQVELGTLTIQDGRTTPIGIVDFAVNSEAAAKRTVRRDNRQ